ncbi:hypothetical protein [Litchfieldella rifensis]|uniref:Uncharacterized protein n=1 Tax=Litchfieldella rifensis TaxID=762643 RepID=A0ABV7LM35_9GAMM
MKKLVSLLIVVAMVYGGLFFYYGEAVKDAVKEGLRSSGFSAVEVVSADYDWLAPLRTRSTASVVVRYRAAEAVVDVSVNGHPIFSSESEIELSGLQMLNFRFPLSGG